MHDLYLRSLPTIRAMTDHPFMCSGLVMLAFGMGLLDPGRVLGRSIGCLPEAYLSLNPSVL